MERCQRRERGQGLFVDLFAVCVFQRSQGIDVFDRLDQVAGFERLLLFHFEKLIGYFFARFVF